MKKLVTVALSCLLLFGMVACSNKTNTDNATTSVDKDYMNTYTGLYDKNIADLGGYDMYTNVDSAMNSYKDTEYPGNETYLKNVKAAYKDSKEKIQAFVDGLKNDVKTDDADLKAKNEELIAEGEKLIKDIDTKMIRLDKITESDYSKTQEDFIKYVDDTVNAGETMTSKFKDMLKDMDIKLGIDRKTIENNNTQNTTK